MSKFKNLVEKFRKAQEQIKELGTDIVKVYPNSQRLVKMTEEIGTAVEALDSLAEVLEEALQIAEQEEALYSDLMGQIKDSEFYSELKPAEQKKLAEWLVQAKQGLATPEVLVGYVEKTLSQKSDSDLIGMLPKAKIVERGQAMNDGSDAFDAYNAGMDAWKRDLEMDRAKAVKELAKLWLSRGFEAIAREFYKEALKPDEKED